MTELYTIIEMAEKLKTTKVAIYNHIRKGNTGIAIPPFTKVGAKIMFKSSTYEDWVNNLHDYN